MAHEAGARRSWLRRALVALLLPPLLAAPLVLVLHRQQSALDAIEQELEQELERAQAGVPELLDANRARANVLARKPIIEIVDGSRPDVVALLNVLGKLPSGVRLDRVETAGTGVSLYGTGSADATSEALRAAGVTAVEHVPGEAGGFRVVGDFAALSAPAREERP